MPANRPATDRTQSLRPLFSWMTSTAPRALGASAHAASSSPCGPAQVIGLVVSAVSIPGGLALDVAAPEEVTGAFAVGLLLSLHAAIRSLAAAVPTPSRASRRRASRRDNKPST